MTETEFATLSGAALEKIEHGLEASGADLDFELAAGGVLEIEFADGSKIIVNRHAVAQEIWVAAKSGGFHFRYDGARWCDSRDGEELMEKLSRLASAQAATPVVLS
ncbi:MAG: iron donor protein CyaY [Betaproteobacteria bacterium]|nr:iron donor protein CyaY [Betaproteobacteria bacterium]